MAPDIGSSGEVYCVLAGLALACGGKDGHEVLHELKVAFVVFLAHLLKVVYVALLVTELADEAGYLLLLFGEVGKEHGALLGELDEVAYHAVYVVDAGVAAT